MRADRRRNVLAAARILGWTSRDGSTRPTRSRTAARMGVTERTVSKLWRVLEDLGYLSCVENGTTAQYRPSWAREEGNLARRWALTLPDEKNGPRPGGRGREVPCRITGPGPALASHRTPENSPRRGSLAEISNSPWQVCPQPKKITDEGLRRESARFLRAGWLPSDVGYAAGHTPDGTPWGLDDPVRHPRAHFRWRLSWWLGPDGTPLPSRSQRRAEACVAVLAHQERRQAERKVGTAPPAMWHEARAQMRRAAAGNPDSPPRIPA
jgi:hypothetical protein